MPIQAKCPNPACGKVLTVKDEHAGKRGKCPACGGLVSIPGVPVVPTFPSPPGAAGDQPGPEAGEEAPAQKIPKKVASNFAAILLFGGGIALIMLAAFAPLFTWISIGVSEGVDKKNVGKITIGGMGALALAAKGDAKTDELPSDSRPEGGWIMGLCFLTALLLTNGFALSSILEGKPAEQVLNGTLLAGLGWAMFLVVWGLAWVWKTIAFSHALQKGLAELKLEIKPGMGQMEFTYQPFPGLGLILLLLAALFVAYLFSQVASQLNKQRKRMFRAEQLRDVSRQTVERLYMGRKELLVVEGVGVLLGGFILLFVVQPWNADKLWKGIKPLALVPIGHSAYGDSFFDSTGCLSHPGNALGRERSGFYRCLGGETRACHPQSNLGYQKKESYDPTP